MEIATAESSYHPRYEGVQGKKSELLKFRGSVEGSCELTFRPLRREHGWAGAHVSDWM